MWEPGKRERPTKEDAWAWLDWQADGYAWTGFCPALAASYVAALAVVDAARRVLHENNLEARAELESAMLVFDNPPVVDNPPEPERGVEPERPDAQRGLFE